MLVTFLMKIFGLAESMLSILPDWRMPDEAIDAFSSFLTEIVKWDNFIPVMTFLKVFTWILIAEITLILVKLTSSVLGFIRGTGNIDEGIK